MQKSHGYLLIGICAFIWVMTQMSIAHAQTIRWSSPVIISNPGTDSVRPALVVDATGTAHIFWIDRPPKTSLGSSYLTHAQVVSDKPSFANEVLTVGSSDYLSAVATSDGFLHLAWAEQESVYYSRAWASDAHNAQAWSRPRVIAAPALIATLVGDDRGRLHLVYSPRERVALSYKQSLDGGVTWSAARSIESPSSAPFAVNASIAIDKTGTLHLAWFNSDNDHWGLEAYYARSADNGTTWSPPRLIDSLTEQRYGRGYGPAWINLAVTGENNVHLIWDGSPMGQRWEQISTDGGLSWQKPVSLFGEMRGITGLNALAVDSAGVLHLISGRLDSQGEFNLMFTSRKGKDWGAIAPVPGSFKANERPSAAVALGNRLYVAWENVVGEGRRIALAYTNVDAPSLPKAVLPTRSLGQTPTVAKTRAVAPPTVASPTAALVQSEAREEFSLLSGPAVGLIAGIFPVLVIILFLIMARSRTPHGG